MPNWLDFSAKPAKKEDEVPEITPQKLSDTLTATKTELETKLKELGDGINNHPTLIAMKEFLDKQRTDAEAAQQHRQQQLREQTGEKFKDMDQTTREYIDTTLGPIATATLMQQGNEMRRSIFEDEDAFPYYTGTLKAKIDALLDAQPASQRANPDIIRNVYKIVVFDNDKEIKENKIKSRLSSASSAGTGTGMSGAADKTALPVLTDQMKSVAKAMGMSEADYGTSMKELQDAGQYA